MKSSNVDRRSFLSSSAMAASFLMGTPLERAWAARSEGTGGNPVVDTSAGKVRGAVSGKVNVFKGIPYGASTEGKGRFLPPSKTQPWTGVKDALEWGHRAPTIRGVPLVTEYAVMDYTGPAGEDCLVVNVWTQGLKASHKRPVMVWLHGGGYANGSASSAVFDGTNLAAKHDVVVVGCNHRLNILGYLYLAGIGGEKYADASNTGMLDIIQSLEWVRDNIANFGGDPNNVTIFGQSGGGSKVSTLMGMPAAKGLFHKAIAMSGSAVNGISKEAATKTAENVLARLGLKANQIDELQTVSLDKLLPLTVAPGPVGQFGPVIDGRSMPAVPFNPVASDLSASVPMIIGSNETEVTWLANQSYDPLDDAALRARVRQALRSDEASADSVIATYKKNRPKASNLDLYLILASDASNFRVDTDLEAERKAEQKKAPVYKHYWQWYSPVRGGALRAMHTMELPFLFQNLEIAKTEVGPASGEMQALADQISGAFTSFARTGNPNHKGLPHWQPFDATERATMIWNTECRVVKDPFKEERMARLGVKKATAA
jgi:para-nitrobenzyl esterase